MKLRTFQRQTARPDGDGARRPTLTRPRPFAPPAPRGQDATARSLRARDHQSADVGRHPGRDAARGRESDNAGRGRRGLPDELKAWLEDLSGVSLADVRVQYNSPRPARLKARAYTQGREIHVAAGQERHLAHEAWHVVQQKQGRVSPSTTLAGAPLNDEGHLEREADEMGAKASRLSASAALRRPVSLPPRPSFARQPRRASVSHTQANAAAPKPTAGPAPIQRIVWKWDDTTKSWSEASGNNSNATPPTHQGLHHGQLYDDDPYSQEKDETVKPFLKSKRKYMGEEAAEKQIKKTKPTSEEVRVGAVKTPELFGGSGLHEVLPTNLGPEVAQTGNPILVGIQSGLRTSTALQLFRQREKTKGGTFQVGAHTGFSPKRTGRGSTHTKGQGPAHDRLRRKFAKLKKETDPELALNEMALRHIKTTPTGQEILGSDYITGMEPNVTSIGKVGSSSTDPSRIKLAQEMHRGREEFKVRARSLKRSTNRGRSPSPEREPIDSTGKGGGYTTKPSSSYRTVPVPKFEGKPKSWEYSANQSAWVSAPMRMGFKFDPPSSVQPQNTNLTPPPSLSLPPLQTTQSLLTTPPQQSLLTTPPLLNLTTTQPQSLTTTQPTQTSTTTSSSKLKKSTKKKSSTNTTPNTKYSGSVRKRRRRRKKDK